MQEDKGDCTEMEKKFLPRKEDGIRVLGRTNGACDPLVLFWTGSGIEMMYDGTELWCEFESDYGSHEQWIAVLINGALISRQMLPKGRSRICLLRGMAGGKQTKVTVLKEVQAMPGDEKAYLAICGLYGDGTMKLPPEPSCKIEFIGDSITSGEGAFGAKQEEEWISMFFGHVHSYPYMVSKELNADYRVFSKSGWGIYCSWDNQPKFNIPSQYENICSATFSEKLAKKGFCEKNDFASWQPDAILVNLGTNDDGAFHNPAFTDENGVTHKMRMKGDKYLKKDGDKVKNAAVEFLKILRRNNENARIFWCYGMLGDGMKEILLAAIKEYKEETKDKKVAFLELPNTTEETVGSRMHPGKASHEKAAKVIVKKLKSVL